MPTLSTEIKLMTQLALPLIAAFMAQKGMQITDTVMMGKMGTIALAASSFAMACYGITLVFCLGTLSSVGVFISRAIGAKQPDKIKIILPLGLYLALFLSIPGMMLIWFFPSFLLRVGEDPRIVSAASLLLHSVEWGFPGFLCFVVLREFVSAFNLARVVMVIALGSIPITICANYILIYGKFGFPALGIVGIGYAGAVIQWSMFLSLLSYCLTHSPLKSHFAHFKLRYLPWHQLIDMIRVGMPSGLILVLDVGMCLMATIIVGYFGEEALAAHQVAMQALSITFTFPYALSMATALRVSYAIGAKDFIQAKRSAYIGIGLGLIISVVIMLFLVLAPTFFANGFLKTNDSHYLENLKLAKTFLAITALVQSFDAIQTIAIGALRGLKDTLIPMILGILCYWLIGIGAAYYLALHTHLGAIGVWYGVALGIGSAAVILYWRLWARLTHYSHLIIHPA